MTTDKLRSVFEFYRDWIKRVHGIEPCKHDGGTHLAHLAYMADAAVGELLPAGKVEKAMRWLGFIQGVLVTRGLFSLEDVKRHSMPDGEAYKP